MIDLAFIERLIRTLDESGLDHVEVERGGTRVRISKSPPPPSPGATSESVAPDVDIEPAEVSPETAGEPVTEPEVHGAKDESLVEIESPMVGTFYRSASPEADAFTEVGRLIAPGDVLCIIEAMKLMNELEAETSGVIQEVCVGDGEPVEYGQVLFRVRPS